MKRLVLYGVGRESEKFKYQYEIKKGVNSFKRDFLFAIDQNFDGTFYSIPVYNPNEVLNLREYFIVVCCVEHNYIVIKEMLREKGLKEFENFIWYTLYEKKLCLINTNCHGRPIKTFLLNSKDFMSIYGVYPIDIVSDYSAKEINESLLPRVDLYIHQVISPDNCFGISLSDKYVLPRLCDDCIRICIPNFWNLKEIGKTFFPSQTDEYPNWEHKNNWPIFYRDRLIDEAYLISEEKGKKDIKSIMDYIDNYQFNRDEVHNNFLSFINKIKLYDERYDIKVSTFIEKEYKTTQMFTDSRHPSKALLTYICTAVGTKLGLTDINRAIKKSLRLDEWGDYGLESPVWPGIKRILGISYKEDSFKDNSLYGNLRCDNGHNFSYGIDIREFIKEYVYLFWNCILEEDENSRFDNCD